MDGTLTVAMHDFDGIRSMLGLPAGRPILEALAALPAERAAELTLRLNEIELKLSRQAKPSPGAAKLLRSLRERGARTGILTRNNRENVRLTLEAAGLSEYFDDDAVVTRDDAPPKPDPGGLHRLLEHWRAAPGDALMIGDYLFDLQAGRAAGVTTVYVDPAGAFPFAEHADLKVESLESLGERLIRRGYRRRSF